MLVMGSYQSEDPVPVPTVLTIRGIRAKLFSKHLTEFLLYTTLVFDAGVKR